MACYRCILYVNQITIILEVMLKVLRLAWSFSDKNSNSTDLYGRVSYFNVEGLESLFGVTNKPNKATPW